MNIVKITKQSILCNNDGVIMLFYRDALISSNSVVGKSITLPKSLDHKETTWDVIKRDSNYHTLLVMILIEKAETLENKLDK